MYMQGTRGTMNEVPDPPSSDPSPNRTLDPSHAAFSSFLRDFDPLKFDREDLLWYKFWYGNFRSTFFGWPRFQKCRTKFKFQKCRTTRHDDANFSCAHQGSKRCSTQQILAELS